MGPEIPSSTSRMMRCLVVEDSPAIRKVARQILQGLGCEVEEAEGGRSALAMCKARMPDLILLDWHLPDSNVHHLLAALGPLRQGEARPRVIYCMTENDGTDRERALAGGADDWLLKPYDRESLSATVLRALAGDAVPSVLRRADAI